MEMKISKKKENPLLQRVEISGNLAFTGATPSNAELKKAIAASEKASEDVIVMKKILTAFGSTTATFLAYVYQSKEQLVKIEPKVKAKAAPAGAAPAPAPEKKAEAA